MPAQPASSSWRSPRSSPDGENSISNLKKGSDDIDDERLHGMVTGFDDAQGLGEIRLDDSEAMFPFHCVSISDGSRTISVGTKVSFDPLLKLGRREAGDVRPE